MSVLLNDLWKCVCCVINAGKVKSPWFLSFNSSPCPLSLSRRVFVNTTGKKNALSVVRVCCVVGSYLFMHFPALFICVCLSFSQLIISTFNSAYFSKSWYTWITDPLNPNNTTHQLMYCSKLLDWDITSWILAHHTGVRSRETERRCCLAVVIPQLQHFKSARCGSNPGEPVSLHRSGAIPRVRHPRCGKCCRTANQLGLSSAGRQWQWTKKNL